MTVIIQSVLGIVAMMMVYSGDLLCDMISSVIPGNLSPALAEICGLSRVLSITPPFFIN